MLFCSQRIALTFEMDKPEAPSDDIREHIARTRVHLVSKYNEAGLFLRRSKAATENMLVPVARNMILGSEWLGRVAARGFDGVKDHPELVGGTALALTLIPVLGWRAR
jgi:hypothetical protein